MLPPGTRVFNVIGRTDLRLFAGLLASCHGFVSNDSGAMHLAAAAGVPVAAIFGPTDERVTAPLGNHDVIIHQVFCRPCMLRDCPIDHRCMRGISVDTVFDAARARDGRPGARREAASECACLERASRAVFLDRDGTVLEEAGYLDRLERLVFFPFAIDAIRLLNRAGFAVVIITNQSGVGRGMYEEAFVHRAHEVVDERVKAGGGRIDGFYYCPHHPTAEIERYRKECDCRKPGPGMLRAAAADLGLDLSRSFAVGDKWTDVQAGFAAGARGILVRTGYGRSSETSPRRSVEPAWIADDLIAATAWILRQG